MAWNSKKRKDDRYESYKDFEDEDELNDETFGSDVYVGKNFDFSGGKPKANVHSAPAQPPNMLYAQAARTPVEDVLKPMASLWSEPSSQSKPQQQAPSQPTEKVLSLEEIEAQLLGGSVSTGPEAQQSPFYGYPPNIHPGQNQQFMQQFPNGVPLGFMVPPFNQSYYGPPDDQYQPSTVQHQGISQMQPPPQGVSQSVQPFPVSQLSNSVPPHVMQMPQVSTEGYSNAGPEGLAQTDSHSPTNEGQLDKERKSEPQNTLLDEEQQRPVGSTKGRKTFDLSSLPALGSEEAHQRRIALQRQHHHPTEPVENYSKYENRQIHQLRSHHRHEDRFYNLDDPNLSPEERERIARRNHKLERILRSSGFMTPKDKDYCTQSQLSQIVTDDPYNEDFYYQVYKVLNNPNANGDTNVIAQKYLEQSGHKLGGKDQRVDVALQRMQHQVSLAVTVVRNRNAKKAEKSKSEQHPVFGKTTSATSKKPRQQLDVGKSLIDRVAEGKEDDTFEEREGSAKDITIKKTLSPIELKFSKSSQTFQLYLIEKIFNEILKLESQEREGVDITDNSLWEALNLEPIGTQQINNAEEIPSFISILYYEKGMKLFPRTFHFLSNEHRLILVNLIFNHLQKLYVILKGSYKIYESNDYQVPSEINNSIEQFQSTVLKSLVLFLSEAKFQDILESLIVLLNNNNLLFLCTTKVGLSIITILISRLELIKQELSQTLSGEDLSTWSSVYDNLFQSLEGRLSSIFPPKSNQQLADDSHVWQFLASLTLAGRLNHQRIIVGEVRTQIFDVVDQVKNLRATNDSVKVEKSNILLSNLNLFLNVMGLNATENDITELKS
ncbi:hypothetical protein LJB42_001213 [Komagataella kurtzmanii]|nr:hypothetical protein LJB42_001213 [Komagataella kurtzmanii]